MMRMDDVDEGQRQDDDDDDELLGSDWSVRLSPNFCRRVRRRPLFTSSFHRLQLDQSLLLLGSLLKIDSVSWCTSDMLTSMAGKMVDV